MANREEIGISPKRLLVLALTAIGMLVFLVFSGKIFENVDADEILVVQSPITKRQINMIRAIEVPEGSRGKQFNASLTEEYGHSAVRALKAKLLIEKNGILIPCAYRNWMAADWNDVGGGLEYIFDGDPVQEENLIELQKIERRFTDRDGDKTILDLSFDGMRDYFITELMENPPEGVQFIRYLGERREGLPMQYHKFLGFSTFKKPQEFEYVITLSLLKLRSDK